MRIVTQAFALLAIVMFVVNTSGMAHAQSVRSQKPNIVFIMGDDIGWMQPGIYHRGLMVGETPNIDRIGREGSFGLASRLRIEPPNFLSEIASYCGQGIAQVVPTCAAQQTTNNEHTQQTHPQSDGTAYRGPRISRHAVAIDGQRNTFSEAIFATEFGTRPVILASSRDDTRSIGYL